MSSFEEQEHDNEDTVSRLRWDDYLSRGFWPIPRDPPTDTPMEEWLFYACQTCDTQIIATALRKYKSEAPFADSLVARLLKVVAYKKRADTLTWLLDQFDYFPREHPVGKSADLYSVANHLFVTGNPLNVLKVVGDKFPVTCTFHFSFLGSSLYRAAKDNAAETVTYLLRQGAQLQDGEECRKTALERLLKLQKVEQDEVQVADTAAAPSDRTAMIKLLECHPSALPEAKPSNTTSS